MIRNYLKIALRNLRKHALFSAINVFGLASGLAVCLLAIAHIRGAFLYDSFHPNRERIFRVQTDVTGRDNAQTSYATSPMPLAGVLKRDYPQVEEAARVVRTYGEVSSNTRRFQLLSFAVDSSFFRVFGYPLAQGSPAIEPGTAVITQETAVKFFGTANPIGQVLNQDGMTPALVTGVLAKLPTPSHLSFEVLFSMASLNRANQMATDWREYSQGYTYVLLAPDATPRQLATALPSLTNRVLRGLRLDQDKGYSLRLQALTGLSPSREELQYGTYEPNIGGLLAEMGIGLLTLLMAAFNYINLTLARSLSRAREVGIRKVAGAVKWQLWGQFMAESMVLSLLALALALLMLELIRPMVFVQQWLLGGVRWDAPLWVAFLGFSVVAGLLAGFVPARVLSGFQPAQVLRSQTGLRVMRGLSLRKSLIVIQFTVSIVAMIALVTMIRQQQYMASGDYGFRRERVLNLPLDNLPASLLANELNKLAGVERVAATSELFGNFGNSERVKRERNGSDSTMSFIWSVDQAFVPTMNLTLLAGQNLPAQNADTTGRLVLLNEEAVQAFRLGNTREAVGKTLWLNDSTDVTVMGVVKDFRFTTFAWKIRPLLLRTRPADFRYLSVAVAAGSETAVLADAKRIWKRLRPNDPYAGKWYNDFLYDRFSHTDDTNFMSLLLGLAFSIACLGLFGMVTYTTQTRTKEVGIRKVMGAEVGQIIWLLSRGFVQWLLLATAIGLPLGYLAGYAILVNFAYHVPMGVETFLLCFGVLLGLGCVTIASQTYRAALTNPVSSLRSE